MASIFYVTRNDSVGRDQCESFVCIADDAAAARDMSPVDGLKIDWDDPDVSVRMLWTTSPNNIVVENLGTAADSNSRLVCAAYNGS